MSRWAGLLVVVLAIAACTPARSGDTGDPVPSNPPGPDLAGRILAFDHGGKPGEGRVALCVKARIDRITTQLDQLTQAHTALRQDRDQRRASTHTLLRAIQVLRLEYIAMQFDIRVLKNQLSADRQGGTPGLYPVPPAP